MQNENNMTLLGNEPVTPQEQSDTRQATQEFVKKILEDVKSGKEFFKKDFERMRADMELVRTGADKDQQEVSNFYFANLVKRHVQQRTAALYAKNPKAEAKIRDKLMYQVWDKDPNTLTMAQQALMISEPGSPEYMSATALVKDYTAGEQRRRMLQGVADTLTMLFEYSMQEQMPNFKVQMKQAVRRALTCSVAYVMLDFQRAYEKKPEIAAHISDFTQRLARIESLMSKVDEGKITELDAEAEELRISLTNLQQEQEVLVREGLLFHFPFATEIIIDPDCVMLKGFVGASWVAREIPMTADDVHETYGVTLGSSEGGEGPQQPETHPGSGPVHYRDVRKQKGKSYILVYEYYHKPTGMVYTVAEGYDNFLTEPKAPNARVEQFFPIFPLTFNDIEDEGVLFPPSDVTTLRPIQRAYNGSRQGLNEHRRASRPKWATTGDMEEDDIELLKSHPANAVLLFKSLQPGQKIGDLLQAVPNFPIDQNVYQTEPYLTDMQLAVGMSESGMGMTSGATATESAIAESSRSTAMGSNIDDLDDFLSEVARAAGQVLMENMSEDQVKSIVGPGAVWPVFSKSDIVSEIYLQIEAGSSGRPNKAEELANLERATPILTQLPGLNLTEFTKLVLKRLDDKLDVSTLVQPGTPSLVALNSRTQPGTGNPATDPAMQGGQGTQPAKPVNPSGGSVAPMGNNQNVS